MSRLSIRSWTEPFPSARGVAVVFDVFRCTTTIHCLAARAAGPLYVAPSLAAARAEPRVAGMRVFSELSQSIDCAARFDNSPFEAERQAWEPGLASLVATTTGTPALFAARAFEKVYVGSLVNFTALVAALTPYNGPVTLIPAAFPDSSHVEDEIACQALATCLEGFSMFPEFVSQCAEQARERILASHRPASLAAKVATGAEDARLALSLDLTPQVLSVRFAPEPGAVLAEIVKDEPCATG